MRETLKKLMVENAKAMVELHEANQELKLDRITDIIDTLGECNAKIHNILRKGILK